MVDKTTNSSLIRSNLWSQEIKEVLQEQLALDMLIDWVTDFPDGDTLNIPTVSELSTSNYSEGSQITLESPTSGNFTLTIDKYYQTGFGITDKFKDDSFYVAKATEKYKAGMLRALMEQKESDIANLQASQTASDPNVINSFDHRWVAIGTSNEITLADFRKAALVLDKAKVAPSGRVAVIDPSVAYTMTGLDTVYRQDTYGSNRVTADGLSRQNIGSYLGFNVYTSLFLDNALAETIAATAPGSGSNSSTAGIANMFCGGKNSGAETFKGAMRTMPSINNWYDYNTRTEKFHTVIRYGLKLYRPESLVVVISEVA